MNMGMTRKHFIIFAEEFSKLKNRMETSSYGLEPWTVYSEMLVAFCNAASEVNDRFDEERFIEAVNE